MTTKLVQPPFNKPTQEKTARKTRLKSQIADLVLAGLVSGPIAAPFLAASGLPVLTQIADIIYTMGLFVCPQPEMSLMLWPHWLMAVCMRCYGTVLALVFCRWLWSRSSGQEAYWLGQYGVWGGLIAVVMMLFYPLEWWLQQVGVWDYMNWVVFPFGWVAGLGLGLWVAPALYSRPHA
ncbi:DUF2085 domain-containing protein [Synechococcus sp. PCC 6312]|uniref:DUF2085 domain-containing protein n=1 Tax=Synechococcus sp. (strain ATCC 27167 / PCC 6312) TaxID=195253 RepID=UPI00029F139B|nr:DUF2085 domain-containing protein [Synechococcus sp. PCC 6312]AFY60626.1 hypothetical protein Syn6312_1458 [Synechococcus sp. PCC 6312]